MQQKKKGLSGRGGRQVHFNREPKRSTSTTSEKRERNKKIYLLSMCSIRNVPGVSLCVCVSKLSRSLLYAAPPFFRRLWRWSINTGPFDAIEAQHIYIYSLSLSLFLAPYHRGEIKDSVAQHKRGDYRFGTNWRLSSYIIISSSSSLEQRARGYHTYGEIVASEEMIISEALYESRTQLWKVCV